MKESMLLRKNCSFCVNDMHFATIVFPYISKEIENNTTVKTILERNEKEYIQKIIENVGLNSEIKEKIEEIDWNETDITKIRALFKMLDKEISYGKKTDIIVFGSNLFIRKFNEAIDLWFKNNIDKLEKNAGQLNIINCFSFDENKEINDILNLHDGILRTSGIEELLGEQELLKAN